MAESSLPRHLNRETAYALVTSIRAEVDGIREQMITRGHDVAAIDHELAFELARMASFYGLNLLDVHEHAMRRISVLEGRIAWFEHETQINLEVSPSEITVEEYDPMNVWKFNPETDIPSPKPVNGTNGSHVDLEAAFTVKEAPRPGPPDGFALAITRYVEGRPRSSRRIRGIRAELASVALTELATIEERTPPADRVSQWTAYLASIGYRHVITVADPATGELVLEVAEL